MKNTIPLIVAVIFGAAAMLLVRSQLARPDTAQEAFVEVVAANSSLDGAAISENSLRRRVIPASAFSARHIRWADRANILGLSLNGRVAQDDYITVSDIGLDTSLSDEIAEGLWAVPVTFADTALVPFLKPGDEIAIFGTYSVSETFKASKDVAAPDKTVETAGTSLVFPRVKILQIKNDDRASRASRSGGGSVLVALAPKDAAVLVAAQGVAQLYPALRKQGDMSNIDYKSAGIVNGDVFKAIRDEASAK